MELLVERICAYMIKAVREAKVHTAWIKPDSEYEEATVAFVKALLDTSGDNPFLRDLRSFVHDVAHFGMLSSLSQSILKMTSRACPICTRAANCGTSASSTPTTVVTWTSPSGTGCCTR
jgi:(1->4)-alpha-D-glucan 1-alpha-D-glucosylmutase